MSKWEIWECDRCGKEMKLSPNSTPQQLSDVKGDLTYDLCADCYSCFFYFLRYNEEFDDLAGELCKKEEEE